MAFMRIKNILMTVAVIFLLLGCGKNKSNEKAEPTDRTVYLYLVALEGSPHEGKQFGCNDKLVPVEEEVSVENSVIEAAVKKLITFDDQKDLLNFVRGPGLMLYQVTIADSIADVYLKGSFEILSKCDIPRIEEQLTGTARQFREYKEVNFFINNKTLEDYLAEERLSF